MSRSASIPQTVIDALQLSAIVGVGGVVVLLAVDREALPDFAKLIRDAVADAINPFPEWGEAIRTWGERKWDELTTFKIELNQEAWAQFTDFWTWRRGDPRLDPRNQLPGHMTIGPASGQDFFTPGQFPGNKVGL